tara:strand:- start:710 stop:1372 length:663 start_codon:yes stop_codon:yes gene_type:complete
MNKIIFVCYNQGAGGEGMATDISKFSNVYDLESKTVGTRTVTRDITKGIGRNDVFKKQEMQTTLNNLPNDKWHVVPTHFKPNVLETLSCKKFYVIIFAGNNESLNQIKENQKQKVWNHVFTDPLELKGQIEAHNSDPHDPYILSRLKGPVQYGKLWSIIRRIDPITEDLEQEYLMWCQTFDLHTPVDKPNCLSIEYLDRQTPVIYQKFMNKLYEQLTKYS